MIESCICEHLPEGEKINAQLVQTFDIFWSRGFLAYTIDETARLVTRAMIQRTLNTGADDLDTQFFSRTQ